MMRRTTGWLLGGIVAALALGVAPLQTSADCEGYPIHEDDFFTDGERVDLSELGDGETRFFDIGDRQVIATRYGDSVELTIEDPEGGDRVIECDVARDRCFVILPGEGGDGRLMIMKTRTSGGDPGEAIFVHRMDTVRDHFVHLDKAIVDIQRACVGDDDMWIGDEGSNLWIGDPHLVGAVGTTLRCPEGDTTMHLDADERDEGPFYCPRHDLELEKAAGHVVVKEIRVQRPHEEQ